MRAVLQDDPDELAGKRRRQHVGSRPEEIPALRRGSDLVDRLVRGSQVGDLAGEGTGQRAIGDTVEHHHAHQVGRVVLGVGAVQ